jgi:hypothetical protein
MMVNQLRLGIGLVLWMLVFAGCTKKSTPAPESSLASAASDPASQAAGAPASRALEVEKIEARPPVAAYKILGTVPAAGHVEGNITFKGTPPLNKAVVIEQAFRTAKPDDFQYCDSKNIKVDKVQIFGSALANAMVEVHGVRAGKAFGAPVAIRATNCRLSPTLILLPAGSIFTVANDCPFEFSAVLKNIEGKEHWSGALALDTKERGPVFDKTGDYFLTSDSHPWMSARVRVMEHPYYAITDLTGAFRIEDIPAGNYEIIVRHEVLGTQRVSVVVTEGATAKVGLAYGQ